MENECMYQLNDIDRFPLNKKGEAVILAHDDYLHIVCNTLGQKMNVLGQIFAPSFIYDISPNTLRDCWQLRQICCSCFYWEYARVWIFFMKEKNALHIEDGSLRGITTLTPPYNNTSHGKALWLVHCYNKLNNGGTDHAVLL
ncbi:unnamed protein product [Brassica oleracea var. botrytis]